MFHSIISDYDVFGVGNKEYLQNQYLCAAYPSETFNNTPQKCFFSTNPADYLRIMDSKNKFI